MRRIYTSTSEYTEASYIITQENPPHVDTEDLVLQLLEVYDDLHKEGTLEYFRNPHPYYNIELLAAESLEELRGELEKVIHGEKSDLAMGVFLPNSRIEFRVNH